jgi:glycosyltransferase involved in cell wall biosynthesis
MRVVHVNTYPYGGAARAAMRLHEGLRAAGVDSTSFTLTQGPAGPGHVTYRWPKGLVSRLRRRWVGARLRREHAPYLARSVHEGFYDDRTVFPDVHEQLESFDVFHLHWVNGLIDVRRFFRSVKRPIVWTLHDLNAFTGGCTYDRNCGRFTIGCGACPQFSSTDPKDLTHDIWLRKQAVFEQVPKQQLTITAPSRWLADLASKSPLLGKFDVKVIPYGLDLELYKPGDRWAARERLGLPAESRIVLFVASDTANPRKGFKYLVDALSRSTDIPDLFLLSLGQSLDSPAGAIPHKALGSVSDESTLAAAYRAADVFVIPSVQDNLPNTVLESMACGTPVVGFDAGGIPEMVRHEQTGLTAPVGDVAALAAAIRRVLLEPELARRLSTQCRAVAESEYSLALQAQRFIELYQAMTERS